MNIGKISLADKVFEQLEDNILDGAYAPGEYLSENKLSDVLGVSRTPVREALRRLAQDGLIEDTPRGALVLGVSEDDIEVIYEIRARVEGYAARLFTSRVTEAELDMLAENVGMQKFCSESGRADSSGDLDTRFHEIIYENCGSRILYDLLSTLHKKVRRYRRASYADPERARLAVSEHRAILDAITARDGGLAERIVTEHVKNAKESILRNLKSHREET